MLNEAHKKCVKAQYDKYFHPQVFSKGYLVLVYDHDGYAFVRDLTSLTPLVGRIIYFHVIKANINKD
jgi:hypothetical protein